MPGGVGGQQQLCELPATWPIAAQKFTARAKQQLRAALPGGTAVVAAGEQSAEQAVKLLHFAWQSTEVGRVRWGS